MNINTKDISFVNFNNQVMEWIKFNGVKVWEAFKNLVVSGIPPLYLNNSVGENLIDYKIYGNSSQEAEPTPNNPKEIKSVGEKTLNLANIEEGLNNCFTKNTDGSYTLTKTSNNRFTNDITLNIPANTAFSIKATIMEYTGTYSQCLQIIVKLEDGSSKYINSNVYNTFKTAIYDKAVISFRIYSDNANAVSSYVTFKDFMVALGNTKQDYEPYGYKIPVISRGDTEEAYEPYTEPTQTNIYLKEPLRKIGGYADYIDFENKKVVRNIYEYKITGNEQYYLCDTNSIRTQFGLIPRIKRITEASSLLIGYACTHNPFVEKSYEYITTYSAQDPTSLEFRKIVDNWGVSEYTVNAWKTFALAEVTKGTPVTFDYVLETPIEELIELPNIPTINGTTILEVDTEIKPSNMEVTYKGK